MAGRTFLSSPVGMGSASQVFAGEANTIFDTSSQPRSQKFSRTLGIERCSACVSDDPVFHAERFDLILVILLMRNSLKLSANSWLVNPDGSDGSLPLSSRPSHTLNICLVFVLCSRKIS